MTRIQIYRSGYIITKIIFMITLIKEYGNSILDIVGTLLAPTIYWLYHFDPASRFFVHIGVVNIVTMWLYYATVLYNKRKKKIL